MHGRTCAKIGNVLSFDKRATVGCNSGAFLALACCRRKIFPYTEVFFRKGICVWVFLHLLCLQVAGFHAHLAIAVVIRWWQECTLHVCAFVCKYWMLVRWCCQDCLLGWCLCDVEFLKSKVPAWATAQLVQCAFLLDAVRHSSTSSLEIDQRLHFIFPGQWM